MRKRLGWALCAMLLVCATARAQNPRKDERAIRAIATHWQNDWNRHDGKALAGLLAVDADYVTNRGVWLRGRADFESWFAGGPGSTHAAGQWLNVHLTLRFLQPEIAIVHLTWTLHGNSDAKGAPQRSRSGISTWLLVKLGAGWKIRTAQDTARP